MQACFNVNHYLINQAEQKHTACLHACSVQGNSLIIFDRLESVSILLYDYNLVMAMHHERTVSIFIRDLTWLAMLINQRYLIIVFMLERLDTVF
jgi:hypothetical protein